MRSSRAKEYLPAAAVAVLIVTAIARCTNSIPALWDAASYVDMAKVGVVGNDHLIAPFAYRPGMPMIVRVLAKATSVDVTTGFVWVGRAMAVLLLFASALLARGFVETPRQAVVPMLFVGLSAMHIKFPLFFATLVDVAAYPLIVLAVWAFMKRRLWLSLLISIVGLLFKEFMIVPLLLGIGELVSRVRRERSVRDVVALVTVTTVAIAVLLVVRLRLHVASTQQEIDPILQPATIRRLVANPLDGLRDLNIALSLASYWLPCLLLITRDRWRALRGRLRPFEHYIVGFLALNLLLVMYGGTNLLVFVAYSAPIQIIVLATLVDLGVPAAEWILALLATFLFNRIAWPIPSPEVSFDAYIDHYAGWWDSRVNVATLNRAVELGW